MADWEKDDSGFSIREIGRKQPYKMEPHSFTKLSKSFPWLYCKHCGLVSLRNELTEWCRRMGCNASDHPEYFSRCRNAKAKN